MCQHDHAPATGAAGDDDARRADSLDAGAAHDHDHDAWTRRDFLVRAGLGAAAVSLGTVVGSSRAYAMGGSPLLGRLAQIETDRVLVLVQLKGGNDGLNTVVPLGNDLYRTARPTIAIPDAATVGLGSGFGLHGALAPLQPMWAGGQMAIVHSVGYPSQSLSHFTGTDVWTTARPVGQSAPAGGWGGRTLRPDYPDFETNLPAAPPAVQIGSQNPLLFQSGDSDLSMKLPSAATIAQIAAGGGLYDVDDVPNSPAGIELGYARAVTNASNRYIASVQAAATAGTNAQTYPAGSFGNDLAAVARLIKGRLASRIYVVQLGSFDTHVNQATAHQSLLGQLGSAMAAFYADLGADATRVLTMTFSEFGRRVQQNGSAGTDHGTTAPLMAFGPAVQGGFYGTAPDLAALDPSGNLRHTTDFRSTYADALGPWFGLDAGTVASVLGGAYSPTGFARTAVGTVDPGTRAELRLDAPFPNPVRGQARLRYSVAETGPVRLAAYDALGRTVAILDEGVFAPGAREATFDAASLPAGVYVLRLETPGASRTVRATVMR